LLELLEADVGPHYAGEQTKPLWHECGGPCHRGQMALSPNTVQFEVALDPGAGKIPPFVKGGEEGFLQSNGLSEQHSR